MAALYMDSSSLANIFPIRIRTRMYIWPLDGDAISGPAMYAHSGSSKGQWAQLKQTGLRYTRGDSNCFILFD